MEKSSAKRRRFQLDEPGKLDDNIQILMDVAARFAAHVNSIHLTKFRNRDKIASIRELKMGDVLMFPTAMNDDEEALDEEWANTSNWAFGRIVIKDTPPIVQIRLLGTIIPDEDEIFGNLRLVEVHIPDLVVKSIPVKKT